jgi:PTS system mannose-specific IIC component
MIFPEFLIASVVSVVAGLDRTAAFQLMVCRPIVAAPLTGWLLDVPLIGLEVGLLVELLWLCFLPVGAAIPPDDTQVAVAATYLAGVGKYHIECSILSLVVLTVFFCCPLGKVGQMSDRWVRQYNNRLSGDSKKAVFDGKPDMINRYHLQGLLTFGLASWASFLAIVMGGAVFLYLFFGVFDLGKTLDPIAEFLRVLFPLAGAAAILANLKVRRSVALFMVSFVSTLMFLWLV